MGFLDDLKKGANDLATSVNKGVSDTQSKYKTDHLIHDLGVLTYLEITGRANDASAMEKQRVLASLQEAEAAGTPVSLTLKTAAAPPPGPPAAGGPPPAPGGAPVPPPPAPGAVAPPPAPGMVAPVPPPPAPGTVAPPPPPSNSSF